jgi:peptide/nickel transport system permease protein
MGAYIVRRLLSGTLLLFAITLVTFTVLRLSPSSPGCLVLPCGPGTHTTDAQLRAAEHRLGADQPVPEQYARFVWRIVRHGSFGAGWGSGSVDQAVRAALPKTISILVGGVVALLLLSIPLGVLSAIRSQTLVDRVVLTTALFGIALHPFVVGYGLKKLFADHLHLVPATGYCHLMPAHGFVHFDQPILVNGEPLRVPACGGPREWAHHLLLPWLTFALFFLPLYVRMIRSQILDRLDEQYVSTARAKGASEVRVLRSHVLRPALLPLATMIGMDFGAALTAVIYLETIYSFGGIGTLILHDAGAGQAVYDLPVVAAVVFLIAAAVIVLNLLVDLLYAWLDPSIRGLHAVSAE